MYSIIISRDRCPILNINSIGYSKSPEVTRFGPGKRDLYIIHYVIEGKGCFNGSPVSAGQGFLITPDMSEEYYPDKTEPWEFLWVMSDDPKMDMLFEYCNADEKTKIFNYNFAHTVKAAADTLIINKNAVYNSFEMLELFFSVFKNHLTDAYSVSKKTNSDIYVEAAVNYIKSNIFNSVTVTGLSEILGISQPYLFKIFKERFGISPKQYITEYKIKHAKKLLAETDMSVTQIADSIGFGDVLCFSKFFSAKVGISPKNYRLRRRQGDLYKWH